MTYFFTSCTLPATVASSWFVPLKSLWSLRRNESPLPATFRKNAFTRSTNDCRVPVNCEGGGVASETFHFPREFAQFLLRDSWPLIPALTVVENAGPPTA